MAKVFTSSVIDAPTERVWARIRDFNGLPGWHPGFTDSRIENDQPSDRIGCVRVFGLAGGGLLHEQLLALSDVEHFYTYTILSSPLPVWHYQSTIRLLPVTDGARTFIQWSCEFQAQLDDEKPLCDEIAAAYQAGLDALKAHFCR